ncbi:MAG: carboxypeptidase M32 [Phycisphaeraceae bacterium]|nr:carboxypeptidase M32 [Phycisphaeraceae bacterium]MCW5754936.1 carboxypeptidase M32 [Phycisphaeraceae bacterium]
MTDAYQKLAAYARETAILASAGSLLDWDQQTYMPSGAAESRAEQIGMIAMLVHTRRTCAAMRDRIEEAEASGLDPQSAHAASVREFRIDFDRAVRLPSELVGELARVTSQAQQAWKRARAADAFASFAPWLERVIGLCRTKAACYGTPVGGEPYDALLNEYEPAATAAQIEAVFTPLRDRLSRLLVELRQGKDPAPIKIKAEAARQHDFGLYVIESIGFDLARGRLDTTAHPFCQDIGPDDVRLTTRYREEHFTDGLYGTLHEAGHGLYEQGLPRDAHFGEPLAQSISLGIHESQSRLWENWVGRSLEFWTWALPHAASIMSAELSSYLPEQVYRAVNTARPSLIRVEADEATYNLHVMIRFELERALFRQEIEARDIPGLWNEMYAALLGLTPPDDTRGCLQDVHWSAGLLGYFPTYTLGNLYMAQFMEQAERDIPGLKAGFCAGSFAALLEWLRANIHRHGRRYRASELCERVTGMPLSADPLLRYLESKLRPIYSC